MSVWMRALYWLKDHWYVPVLLIGLIFAVLWVRGTGWRTVLANLKLELAAIAAKGEARKAQVELGAEKAKAQIEQKYQSQIIKLTADQKAEAEKLQDDPVALAQFLVRAGGQ